MVRWIVVLLFSGCLVAQVANQPEAEPAGPTPAVDQTPSIAAPALPAKTGFPFDPFKEFSATMVGSLLPGDDRETKIYRSGKWLRTEAPEGHGYMLTELTNFETYGINRFGCMHDQHPYFRAFPFTADRRGRKMEPVPAGTETVDGHLCQMEDITLSSPDLIKPMKLRFWLADDLQGFPIKIEVLSGAVHGSIEYKDVVLGPQDARLFEHPKSCKGTLPQREATKKPAASRKAATPPAPASAGDPPH